MKRKIRKSTFYTIMYAAAIALCGVIHMFEGIYFSLLNTLLFSLNTTIYLSLIFIWAYSVNKRLLPTRAKRYILSAAVFMILFFVFRVISYRIVFSKTIIRYSIYGYYISLIMIAALFFVTSLRLFKRGSKAEPAIITVSAVLGVLVLFNDFHFLMYKPKVNLSEFMVKTGTYGYGALFYSVYAWIISLFVFGVVLLVITNRRLINRRKAAEPFAVISVFILLLIANLLLEMNSVQKPYMMPEICIFSTIALFEICIRNRLIPYNENYIGIFESLALPAVITDRGFAAAYHSASELNVSKNEMRSALLSPIYLDKNTRLNGSKIQSGYIFYTTEETALNRLNNELRETGEALKAENELIAAENEQKEKEAKLKAQSEIYTKAMSEIHGTQKKIFALLDKIESGNVGDEALAEVLILDAYVKRRTNFILTENTKNKVSRTELKLALEESARMLAYKNISATVHATLQYDLDYKKAMAVYDSFELITEALLDKVSFILIVLSDDRLALLTDSTRDISLPETPLPVSSDYEDGQLRLTVCFGGERI